MNNSLISVIVPVNNAENYIERCLNSIIDNSYKNIEIIIVINGSKDNSYKICEKYKNKYCNIFIYIEKEPSVSKARNIGFNHSHGDYICFIDADDYIGPHYFSDFIKVAKKTKCDIVYCDYIMGSEEEYNFENINIKYKEIQKENYYYGLYVKYDAMYVAVWNKLFKKNLIENIRFEEKLRFSEDRSFMSVCVKEASTIFYLHSKNYYYYRGNNNSICNNSNQLIRMDQVYSLLLDYKNFEKSELVAEYINLSLFKTAVFRYNKAKENKLLDLQKELKIIVHESLINLKKSKKINIFDKYRTLVEYYFPSIIKLETMIIKIVRK